MTIVMKDTAGGIGAAPHLQPWGREAERPNWELHGIFWNLKAQPQSHIFQQGDVF